MPDDKLDNSTVSEHDLLQRIAGGDRAAFEQLFKLYHPRIYKFVMRLLPDHQLVEEIVCDSLFAVWQGADSFRGQSTVSSWIFGIAYRRAMKSHRNNVRHQRHIEPDADPEVLTEHNLGTNPERQANSAMESAQLLTAMASLSTDHQAVLELTALGHSCAEISAIVRCPENTVKTRTFYARRKLKQLLQTA